MSQPVSDKDKAKQPMLIASNDSAAIPPVDGCDDWAIPTVIKQNQYFVEITTTMADALVELDKRMRDSKDHHLISRKPNRPLGGHVVEAGYFGVWACNGRPIIAIRPGNYWNFSWRHTWQCKAEFTKVSEVLGLTTCQVGQSEAAVIMDPNNRIFIIRNGGFAAFGSHGLFRVIEVVDTLNLGDSHAHYETEPSGKSNRGRILGWKRDVRVTFNGSSVVVATFFVVPANNRLILQRGNDLLMLNAGQHVITNPHTTFRGFYSLGEHQTSFRTQPAYTIEGVPVVLHVNLRYRIVDPLLLAANYDDAFQALANPAQTAVNSVVSRLSYQQFMRAKSINVDVPDFHADPWLDAFKTECLRDLTHQASHYGILVESFDVLDRELEGALGKDLEKQSERVLRNQVEATQISLQNHIATETQRGKLEIAQVEAEQRKTAADASYYVATRESDAAYYKILKSAEAEAESSQLRTQQEAKNVIALADAKRREIELLSEAYAKVPEGHAQRMQLSVYEIEKRKALPAKTIYFSGDKSETPQDILRGVDAGLGWNIGATLGGKQS